MGKPVLIMNEDIKKQIKKIVHTHIISSLKLEIDNYVTSVSNNAVKVEQFKTQASSSFDNLIDIISIRTKLLESMNFVHTYSSLNICALEDDTYEISFQSNTSEMSATSFQLFMYQLMFQQWATNNKLFLTTPQFAKMVTPTTTDNFIKSVSINHSRVSFIIHAKDFSKIYSIISQFDSSFEQIRKDFIDYVAQEFKEFTLNDYEKIKTIFFTILNVYIIRPEI
jgi:hypothetical protein